MTVQRRSRQRTVTEFVPATPATEPSKEPPKEPTAPPKRSTRRRMVAEPVDEDTTGAEPDETPLLDRCRIFAEAPPARTAGAMKQLRSGWGGRHSASFLPGATMVRMTTTATMSLTEVCAASVWTQHKKRRTTAKSYPAAPT
jgi:hypothetical protein